MKNFFCICLIFFSLYNFTFSTDFNSKESDIDLNSANFRTALRYAQIAKSFMIEGDYNQALEQCQKGLSYEKDFSDLLYIKSYCLLALNKEKYFAIEAVEQSLKNNNFKEINPNSARIVYADLLSDTLRSQQALEVLDYYPIVFSADAELIRAKSNYRLKNFKNAQKNIFNAIKLFPSDYRFPLLYFKNETAITEDSHLTNKLLSMMSKWQNSCDEILLYASTFVDEEQKFLFLSEYKKIIKSIDNFDYILFALNEDIINQEEAIFFLIEYLKLNPIFQSDLITFLNYINEEPQIQKLKNFFETFSGTILQDLQNDSIADLFINYINGQIDNIKYFQLQDDNLTYNVKFTDNKVTSLDFAKYNLNFDYYNYPYVEKIKFNTGEEVFFTTAELVLNEIIVNPVNIQSQHIKLSENFKLIDFNHELPSNFTFENFINNVSIFNSKTEERENAYIRFSVLDGKIISADYFCKSHGQYAFTAFEHNLPIFRNVDKDCDGIYEVTEFYKYDKDNYLSYQTLEEKYLMDKTLFGTLAVTEGVYLSKVVCDTDVDGINNYFEVYNQNNTKICGWDTDKDGIEDIGFETFVDGSYQIFYKDYYTKENVYCKIINDIPYSIIKNSLEIPVTKDKNNAFYWIGEVGSSELANYIMQDFVQSYGSKLYVKDNQKIFATKVNNVYFGELLNEF